MPKNGRVDFIVITTTKPVTRFLDLEPVLQIHAQQYTIS